MKVLIVGLGSIAKKHIYALNTIYEDVQLWALRSVSSGGEKDVTNIYDWNEVPQDLDFIIISNPTSEHYNTILKASSFKVPLFIEKPPTVNVRELEMLVNNADLSKLKTYVAFNFRFHPVIQWLKKNISDHVVVELQAYCGSYLPDWRPGTDYTKNYSAMKELGGGVHLDLIHELDFVMWLCGLPEKTIAVNAKKSKLKISSADFGFYLLEYKDFMATITLNYYRKFPARKIEIVLEDAIWYVDLLKGEISNQKGEMLFSQAFNVMDSYVDQMKYFVDCISSDAKPMNSLKDSIETMKICLNENAGK